MLESHRIMRIVGDAKQKPRSCPMGFLDIYNVNLSGIELWIFVRWPLRGAFPSGHWLGWAPLMDPLLGSDKWAGVVDAAAIIRFD